MTTWTPEQLKEHYDELRKADQRALDLALAATANRGKSVSDAIGWIVAVVMLLLAIWPHLK